MSDQNCWNATGRLCADPELRYTASGVALANLRLACNRIKETNGQKADFFSLTVWRSAAEFAANYLNKGAQVAVTGRLENRQWQATDGSKRTSTEVRVDFLYSLGKSVQSEPDEAPSTPDTTEPDPEFNDPFADQ